MMPTPEDQREYQRAWVAKRRAEWFVGKSCAWCESTEQLELDHVDPATKHPMLKKSSGSVWTWTKEKREAELALCQALCKPCHQIKTERERQTHSVWRYYDHGCRCEICCQAAKDYRAKRNAKRAANREEASTRQRASYASRSAESKRLKTLENYSLVAPDPGPCSTCGCPDARHRIFDAVSDRLRAGEDKEALAADYELPIENIDAIAKIRRPGEH